MAALPRKSDPGVSAVSFTVETTMLPSFAPRVAARFVTKSFEGIRLRASLLRRDTGFIVLA